MKKSCKTIDLTKINQWKLYNGALVSNSSPHETVDTEIVENGLLFKHKGGYFARWTTDFDCNYETEWWYVIKDTPFDINSLKAKRRYEINKGIKNFDVKIIKATDYPNELFEVQQKAYSAYPEKYRPQLDKDKFINNLVNWEKNGYIVFGAFYKETGKLCGYSILERKDKMIEFSVQKTIPDYEKLGVNMALVNTILLWLNQDLSAGRWYVCDGSRSIVHETAFQDWLEKYFGFRKAYCRLNIAYNPKYKFIIKICYLFRKILYRIDNVGIVHKINGVLKMEEIVRRQKKNESR
jgi:hypothetical protein